MRLVARHTDVDNIDTGIVLSMLAIVCDRPRYPEYRLAAAASAGLVDIRECDDFCPGIALPAWDVRHSKLQRPVPTTGHPGSGLLS